MPSLPSPLWPALSSTSLSGMKRVKLQVGPFQPVGYQSCFSHSVKNHIIKSARNTNKKSMGWDGMEWDHDIDDEDGEDGEREN